MPHTFSTTVPAARHTVTGAPLLSDALPGQPRTLMWAVAPPAQGTSPLATHRWSWPGTAAGRRSDALYADPLSSSLQCMFQVHSVHAPQLNAMLCSQQHKAEQSHQQALLVLSGVLAVPGMWHVGACTYHVLSGDAPPPPRVCV